MILLFALTVSASADLCQRSGRVISEDSHFVHLVNVCKLNVEMQIFKRTGTIVKSTCVEILCLSLLLKDYLPKNCAIHCRLAMTDFGCNGFPCPSGSSRFLQVNPYGLNLTLTANSTDLRGLKPINKTFNDQQLVAIHSVLIDKYTQFIT